MAVGTDIRSTQDRLLLMSKTAEEMLQMTWEALKHDQIDLGDMAEKLAFVIQEEQREVLGLIVEIASAHPDAEPRLRRWAAIVSHLERVSDHVIAILQAIRDKMELRVQFSPEAMRELKFLFESLEHLLHCTRDAIQTGNPILQRYLIDTANTLDASADQSVHDHLDRLMTGDCTAIASPIYHELIDSLKGIVRHMRLLAECLLP